MTAMDQDQKISFIGRNPIECPACGTKFFREDLLSGGGRLIAGSLSEELRRIYEPSKKFGVLCPLLYPVNVCPACLFALYPQDFGALSQDTLSKIKADDDRRKRSVATVFPDLDFTAPRTLREGTASYFLAVMSYELCDKHVYPTFKCGLSSLRAAWLCGDLHAKLPNDNYDYMAKLFYRKARFYYQLTLEKEQKGQEPLEGGLLFGPDLDKNYGFDGMVYLTGYLDYRHGSDAQPEKRVETLENAKRMVAKIFGMGKASKGKPSVLLEMAKDLYAKIGEEIEALQGEKKSPP
jgi:uncharacterized protein